MRLQPVFFERLFLLTIIRFLWGMHFATPLIFIDFSVQENFPALVVENLPLARLTLNHRL